VEAKAAGAEVKLIRGSRANFNVCALFIVVS